MDYDSRRSVSVAEQFGHVLRMALKSAYGKLPSAAFVAREFNLRCAQNSSVSQETTRRWMRGYSIAGPDHLSVLSAWLEIDCNQVFSHPHQRSQEHFSPKQAAQRTGAPWGMDDPFYIAFSRLSQQQRELIYDLLSLGPTQSGAAKPI